MMSLEQKRSVLRAQHDHLRELIAALRDAAASVAASSDESLLECGPALAAAISVFDRDLRVHLGVEEELLGPILERVDAWGPVRLELMRAEHAHQRAVLEALRTDRRVGAREMARRASALTTDVLADMDAEESEVLAESVLRDDALALDQSDC